MFKKYILIFATLSIIFSFISVYAFINKNTSSTFEENVSYTGIAVSADDFNDTIYVKLKGEANTNYNVFGNFNASGIKELIQNTTTDSSGIKEFNFDHLWDYNDLLNSTNIPKSKTYQVAITASLPSNPSNSSNVSNYNIVVTLADISLTSNPSMTNGGKISSGDTIIFQCTNATTMTISPAPASPSTWSWSPSGYTHTGTFTNKDATSKQYTIICQNIGGTSNQKTFTFNTDPAPASCPQGQVKDSTGYCHPPCPTGQTWNETSKICESNNQPTFDITNINSSPNQSGIANTFTWTSEADTCNVYTNDKATRLNPSASTKSGNNFSATVPAQNMSNAPGSYLYYIKCYSGTRTPSDNIEKDSSDPAHTGWKSYTTTLSCPTGTSWDNVSKTCKTDNSGACPQGQVKDSTGYCHIPCEPYQDWYEAGRYCNNICNPAMIYDKSTNTCSCPSGTTWNGSTCAAAPSTFNITSISSNPNQASTANTFTWVSEADTCNVYTNDKATRLNPSASTKSGNNFSATVPSYNMPTGQGSYLYYIKCYSSTKSPASNLEADTSDPAHTGWKSYTVSISCPAGQVANSGETCHNPCPSGQIWDEGSKTCKVNNSSTFNILNISTNPNEINKTITFSWWSDAGENYCHIYNYDKSATIGYALKQSSQNWTTNVSSDKLPSTPGVYGYYIRCSDRNKHADSSLEETTDGTYYFGWKNFNLTLTCPNGQSYNSNSGKCENDTPTCPNGQSYNAYYDRCEPDSCPAGQELVGGSCQPIIQYFNISSINVSPKETGKNNTFTWYSEADTCNVYSYEFQYGSFTGVRLNPSASTKSGNNFSAIVPAQNMPSSAGNYGYYIKCQSTDASRESVESLRPTWDNDIYTGWKYYTVTLTTSMPACPDGQVRSSPTGVCHSPCPSGYTWNEASRVCGNPNPTCDWSDPATKMSVACSVPYVCENGATPELRVYYKDGHYDVINPATNPFTWDTNQYQYQFYCSPTVLTPIAPLRKTYTHFITFNVSASNIKKGTGVNLNWSVEDPNATCKIVGVSIKNPNNILFDSKSNNKLNNAIATSTLPQGSIRALATGDYNSILNKYLTINESMRFTASCTDTGTYKPGYYQLVRDIYVIGEEER